MTDLLRLEALAGLLAGTDLDHWAGDLESICSPRLSSASHGDFDRWQEVLRNLESAAPADRKTLLLELAPWRKGPFNVGGVDIDSEWRSDLKWSRVVGSIAPLDGCKVLDVGCGLGGPAFHLAETRGAIVTGVDLVDLNIESATERASTRGLRDRVQFRVANALDLPFADEAFDVVFGQDAWCHVPDKPG